MGENEHVSERFRRLLALYRKPNGSEWGGQVLENATGRKVTRSYVANLKNGRIENPGLAKLEAISKAMGFPPALQAQVPLPEAQRGARVEVRLAHAGALSLRLGSFFRTGLGTGSRLGSLRGSCTVLFFLGPISAIVASTDDVRTLPPRQGRRITQMDRFVSFVTNILESPTRRNFADQPFHALR